MDASQQVALANVLQSYLQGLQEHNTLLAAMNAALRELHPEWSDLVKAELTKAPPSSGAAMFEAQAKQLIAALHQQP